MSKLFGVGGGFGLINWSAQVDDEVKKKKSRLRREFGIRRRCGMPRSGLKGGRVKRGGGGGIRTATCQRESRANAVGRLVETGRTWAGSQQTRLLFSSLSLSSKFSFLLLHLLLHVYPIRTFLSLCPCIYLLCPSPKQETTRKMESL